MAIPVTCEGCGSQFNAPDRGAGRTVPCPKCKAAIEIPVLLAAVEEDEYRLAEEAPRPPPVTVPAISPAAARPMPARPPAVTPVRALPVPSHPAPMQTARPVVALPRQGVPQPAAFPRPVAAPPASVASPAAGSAPAWVPETKSSTPAWLRHLHWCLAVAMLPLAVSIFLPDESPEELMERLVRSIARSQEPVARASGNAAGDVSTSAGSAIDASGTQPQAEGDAADPSAEEMASTSATDEEQLKEMLDELSLDEALGMVPGGRLEGALLPRRSYAHWLFALVSVSAFMAFFVLLASDQSAHPFHLLGLGAFTATIGILLLLVVQVLASAGVIGGEGIAGLIAFVLFMIGLSYSAALDPNTGFFASFLGFTFGVGLCEELCKALPILVYYHFANKQTWRGAFLWGLASGMGFGVSEGIMYSQDFYNGIAGPGIYVVRFVSCVALHAVWAGSVGIAINQWRGFGDWAEEYEEWWVKALLYVLNVMRALAVPMVLHGLYDTLLKKDLPLLALVVAAASFGYLAWLISRLRHSDDEDERAAYVSRYIRSQIASAQSKT